MSETSDSLTSSDVRHRLSVHARTMKELSDRAADAMMAGDTELCEAYITAVEEELALMVKLIQAHRHLLRPPA